MLPPQLSRTCTSYRPHLKRLQPPADLTQCTPCIWSLVCPGLVWPIERHEFAFEHRSSHSLWVGGQCRCLIMNFRHGPWLSCSWWKQLQGGVDEFIRLTSPGDELWLHFYTAVAHEFGVSHDVEFGTFDHIERVKQMLITSQAFQSKGEKVALRSFFKWIRAMKTFAKSWHALLVILDVVGVKKNWFSAGSVPGVGASSSFQLPSVNDLPEEAQRAAGCNQDQTLQQLRNQFQNSMHAVAEILGNSKKEFVIKCMAALAEPIQIEHDLTIKLMNTPRSVLQYYRQLALGKFCFTIVRILRLWESPECFASLGVAPQPADFSGLTGPIANHPVVLAEVSDESERLALMWEFTWRLMQRRLCSLTHFLDGWPGPFALLLTEGGNGDMEAGLANCKVAWEAIASAEEAAHTQPQVKALLAALSYQQMLPVRESWLALSLWGFRWAPPPALDVWRTVFFGWGNSTVVEDGFNVCKDHQRDAKHISMARHRRWALPFVSGMFEQRYERSEVKPEEGLGSGRSKITSETFASQSAAPTVPDSLLRGVMDLKTSWLSYTPQGENIVPAAMNLLLTAHDESDGSIIRNAWHAMFFIPGSLVEHTETNRIYLVLFVCQFGVLGWPCEEGVVAGDTPVITPCKGNRTPHHWFVVRHLDDWRVHLAKPLGPTRAHWLLKESSKSYLGIRLVCEEGAKQILQFAAVSGFRDITDHWLSKLIKSFGISPQPGSHMPRSVLGRVELLIRHFGPGLTDAEVRDIMLKRAGAREVDAALQLTKEAEVAADRLLEAADQTDHKNTRESTAGLGSETKKNREYLAARGLGSHSHSVGAGSTSLDGPIAASAPRPREAAASSSSARVHHNWPMHVRAAKDLLPKGVKGVILAALPVAQVVPDVLSFGARVSAVEVLHIRGAGKAGLDRGRGAHGCCELDVAAA